MRVSRRPRRWLIGLGSLVVVGALLTGAVGWYYSDQLLLVRHTNDPFEITVLAVDRSSVTLARSRDSERPGTFGLVWGSGHAVITGSPTAEPGGVRREWQQVRGVLHPGDRVRIDADPVDGDPSVLGLRFTDVSFPDGIGPMPAWFLPASRPVWVLCVHGRGASRQEALRVLPLVHRLGYPVLDLAYRNDVGAPRSPDHLYHLGDTEWRDAAAGIRYATAHGATGVVLFGWSMGGAIVEQTLARATEAAAVRGVVLDSPVVDWRSTLGLQAANRGLPSFLTGLAVRIVHWRIGMNFDRFDLRRKPLALPTLLFGAGADHSVPIGPTDELARSNPATITYLRVANAGHTEDWNVDPGGYAQAVTAFLAKIAP